MKKFVATAHKPEIAVKIVDNEDMLTISVNYCPSIQHSDEFDLESELEIHVGEVPRLIQALAQAYEHKTGEKP